VGKDACTIVGVLPATLTFPDEIDLWIPAPSVFQNLNRPSYFLNIVGRLAPGVTLSQASAEMQSINARLWKEYPATDADIQVHLSSLQDAVVEDTRTPLLTLLAAVGAVLMVACVNIAGLMLARGWARQRESGVRAALGAGVGRLVRLRFFEVAWLAADRRSLRPVYRLWSDRFTESGAALRRAPIGGRAVRRACSAVYVMCCNPVRATCSLPPAWHEAMGPMIERMRQGSGGSVGPGKRRLRSALVVGQVALSMTLLVCAALLGHSLLRMQQVRLGFQPEQAIAMHTAFGWDTGAIPIRSFSREVVDSLSALPGVSEAGVVDRLPLNGGAQSSPMVIRGRELSPELASQSVGFRPASAGYFRALRVPVLRGTLFPDHPDENGPKLVVVNERFAKRYFPDGDPVGQMIKAHPTAKAVEDKIGSASSE
jgi:predicted permease